MRKQSNITTTVLLLQKQQTSWLFRYVFTTVLVVISYNCFVSNESISLSSGSVMAFVPLSTSQQRCSSSSSSSSRCHQQQQNVNSDRSKIMSPATIIQRSLSTIPLFITMNDSNNNTNEAQQQQQQIVTSSTTTLDEESTSIDHNSYDLLELVIGIVQAADGRKAENIRVLDIAPISTVCSYMVIVTGNSRPQNEAIAGAVEDYVLKTYHNALRPVGRGVPEGTAASGWIIIDYGSVMVHIMTPKSRLYYNIEGQWQEKGASYLDLSSFIIPNKIIEDESTNNDNVFIDKDESDPFWS